MKWNIGIGMGMGMAEREIGAGGLRGLRTGRSSSALAHGTRHAIHDDERKEAKLARRAVRMVSLSSICVSANAIYKTVTRQVR